MVVVADDRVLDKQSEGEFYRRFCELGFIFLFVVLVLEQQQWQHTVSSGPNT
ncbi:hypothetical protein Lser_V15G16075 [Lactuca serriola]